MRVRSLGLILLSICGCTHVNQAPSHQDTPTREKTVKFQSGKTTHYWRLPTKMYSGLTWINNSHTADSLDDCSDEKWYCIAGTRIALIAPKKCEVNQDEWKTGTAFAKFMKREGDLYYYAIYDRGRDRSEAYYEQGIVYSYQDGVVGTWYRINAISSTFDSKNIQIYRIAKEDQPFMKCSTN